MDDAVDEALYAGGLTAPNSGETLILLGHRYAAKHNTFQCWPHYPTKDIGKKPSYIRWRGLMLPDDEIDNYETFRDCVSELVLARSSRVANKPKKKRAVKGRKNEIKPVARVAEDDEQTDAEELGEFIEYLASEIFASLPDDLRTLSYGQIQNDDALAAKYSTPIDTAVYEALIAPLPPSVPDSMTTYSLLPESVDLNRLLEPVLTAYIDAAVAAPPEHTPTTRATECEICDRDQLPLTYHHLIPRQMHAKAVKRGWAKDWELQKVAWLCRACHSFVHRIASNEELARDLKSVEALMEREDVQAWAKWVGRVRWKAR